MATQATETLPIGQLVRVNAKWSGRVVGRYYVGTGDERQLESYGVLRSRKDGTDARRVTKCAPADVRPVLSLQVVRKPEYYCGAPTGRIYFTCETRSGTAHDGTGAVLGRGYSDPQAVADFLFRCHNDGLTIERAQLSVTHRIVESDDGLWSRVDTF